MVTVKIIRYESEVYEQAKRFREEVLRRPLGLTLSAQDLQGEESQTHIVAVGPDEEVVGTVVLKPLSSWEVKLRQMAVASAWQRRGVGKRLVRFAEGQVFTQGFRSIEMHARMSAKDFYGRLGYQAVGKPFIEVTVPTIKMIRLIRP